MKEAQTIRTLKSDLLARLPETITTGLDQEALGLLKLKLLVGLARATRRAALLRSESSIFKTTA